MKVLNKEDILSANDVELELLEVEEWGGAVYIGAMSVEERLMFDDTHCDENGKFRNLKDPNLVYDMLELTLKNEDGTKMFGRDDIKQLKSKNAKVVHKIFYKALNANYVSAEAAEVVKKK